MITSDGTETSFGIFDSGAGDVCCIVYEICVQAETAAGRGGPVCVNASKKMVLVDRCVVILAAALNGNLLLGLYFPKGLAWYQFYGILLYLQST